MEKLSYQILKEQNYKGYLLREAPERVLQFGEGNFMRAFTDHFIDMLNEKTGFNGKAVLVQPRPKRPGHSLADDLNTQEGLYTLYLRGFENGRKVSDKRVISCVSRCLNAYEDYDAVMACAEILICALSPATPPRPESYTTLPAGFRTDRPPAFRAS